MKSCVPKEEVPQKFVAKIQYDHRIWKVKKVVLPAKPAAVPSTFDEAKASCKARKRKERQESVSSQYQERKVIRSNSEERPASVKPPQENANGMRRVSSSGDFPKCPAPEEKSKSPRHGAEQNEKTLKYDDYEHDKRRSHERFARPHVLKNRKYPNKRYKVRPSKIKLKCTTEQEIATSTKYLEIREEGEKSPSPKHTPVTPVLDFATLHEQVDSCEPLLSQHSYKVDEDTETMPSQHIASTRLHSSPRNSIIATHRIYLDPDLAQSNLSLKRPSPNPVEERILKLTKQIDSCKRKIKTTETAFELKNGAKPSQFDRMNDEVLRKLYFDLNKLKKEQKQLLSLEGGRTSRSSDVIRSDKAPTLQETVEEIEQLLSSKRETNDRNISLDSMTAEQLMEEKVATQKALLYLESVHGRAQSKEDRDVVRPFYDRYRLLKRMVAKTSIVGTTGELATIHENETMNFVTPTSSSNETESEKTETPETCQQTEKENPDPAQNSENLHSLTKPDLIKQIKAVTEEKKELRRKIKEFENDLQTKTGRMITREDKKPMEEVYGAYKKVKCRLRLLQALVAKY